MSTEKLRARNAEVIADAERQAARLRFEREHTQQIVDRARVSLDSLIAQRDRLQRLFNRLEAAISHHRQACEQNDVPDVHDEALWAARDRVLRDAREGKG
jgi:hypothetical protein